jgi:hypothetical protein
MFGPWIIRVKSPPVRPLAEITIKCLRNLNKSDDISHELMFISIQYNYRLPEEKDNREKFFEELKHELQIRINIKTLGKHLINTNIQHILN